MAEESQVVEEKPVEEAIEDQAADFLFGTEDEYEPAPEPVVEGEESEVEASDEEEAPEFVEVEYDGQLYEVPPELKDAVLRQADYTTKTQEVATQRKQAEVLLGEIEQARQRFEFAEKVQPRIMEAQMKKAEAEQYQEYLSQYINSPDFNVQNVEQIRERIRQSQHEAETIATEIQKEQQEFQQAQEQAHVELLNKGTEVLSQKIPGWGEESQKQLRDYGLSNGFTEAELNQLIDPREVETLWKASQYDALQAGKAQAVKKAQSAPAIKPKARDPKSGKFVKQKKMQNALKSGKLSESEKAKLIGEDIASRFFG